MQCANCRFENMPGSADCARCGTSMKLATMTIDVHPPRAPKWLKPAHRAVRRGAGLRFHLRDAMKNYRATAIAESKIAPSFTREVALRLIVPGWAQFYLRRRGRGYVFMTAAGIALLFALVFVGTTLGNLALGMLFSMHSASVSDAVLAPGSNVRESIFAGLMVYAVLGGIVYLPGIWLVTRITMPYVLQDRAPSPFLTDDVLLVRRFPGPKPGNVVVYNRPDRRFTLNPLGHEARYLDMRGLGVDRILAGPGDHLVSSDGELLLNNKPVSYRPLNGGALPEFDRRVPAGE